MFTASDQGETDLTMKRSKAKTRNSPVRAPGRLAMQSYISGTAQAALNRDDIRDFLRVMSAEMSGLARSHGLNALAAMFENASKAAERDEERPARGVKKRS